MTWQRYYKSQQDVIILKHSDFFISSFASHAKRKYVTFGEHAKEKIGLFGGHPEIELGML